MKSRAIEKIKKKFPFGTEISYHEVLYRSAVNHRGEKHDDLEWKNKEIGTRYGIVVGWKWLKNGKRFWDPECGYSFQAAKNIFILEVKSGMMNNVRFVLPENVDTLFVPERLLPIPDFLSNRPAWSESARQEYREYAAEQKRDSKGRWTK